MTLLLTSEGFKRVLKLGSRRAFALCFLSLAATTYASGQSAQVISFDDLQQKQLHKRFSWTNPDSSREEITITQMRVPADTAMIELTRRFQLDNYGRNSVWVEPRMIVIHSMDFEDLRTSLEQSAFLDRAMPGHWETVIKAGPLPPGAHFIIDRDGEIYCLTPPSWINDETKISYNRYQHKWLIRRHLDAIPMAIGIENVTPRDGSFEDLSEQQISSNARLVRWLLWMERGSVKYVMSHHQFNDTLRFELMIKEFSLTPPRPLNRAWTRKDVGDDILKRILTDVRRRRWVVRGEF